MSTALVDALLHLGFTDAFGVMGGAIAPFFRALATSPMRTWHMRHEAGAAFAAIEASLATRRPTLVFTTAGPGLSNAFTGMLSARWDGAHVLFVSACSIAAQRGRVASQETSEALMGGAGLFQPGGALHDAATLEHPAQLIPAVARLAAGLTRPGGFVAHLSLPVDVQRAPCGPLPLGTVGRAAPLVPPAEVVAEHAALLDASPPVLWLGFGARHAAAPIRALAERLGARVMGSPRAKGIFPEDHPAWLGVTGLAGHSAVDRVLAEDPPETTLVLGSRLGESTSFWSPVLAPRGRFLHVDADPTVFGVAYPHVPTHAVVADVGAYVEALLGALGPGRKPAPVPVHPMPVPPPPRADGRVRPQVLLDALQRRVVDGSDAWLMAESGNAFCWSTHHLRFPTPGRYRASTGFGSMGHAACGVVGAALARRGKAFALVGDGAMLMLNEVHAAVQHRADAVWVVLDDAGYRMCAQGMQTMGWPPMHCDLPPVDFVALARALGADGERVATEAELDGALERALLARGPWVLDVHVDPAEAPPSGRRNRSLMEQGNLTGGAS